MSERTEIESAAELVNSMLVSKGFLAGDPLRFSSISEPNSATNNNFSNDKQIINTLYSLLNELDNHKSEKHKVVKELHAERDKTSSLRKQVTTNEDKMNILVSQNLSKDNEIAVLKKQNKQLSSKIAQHEKAILYEKSLNNSLVLNFNIKFKKQLNKTALLQDKLLNNNKKIKIKTVVEDSGENGFLIDQEINKLMGNLNSIINKLSVQNNNLVSLVEFLTSFIELLAAKHKNQSELHAEFQFLDVQKYYENYQKEKKGNDEGEQVGANDPKFNELRDNLFTQLNSFFKNINSGNNSSEKLKSLTNEINLLKSNLNLAIETNDKWKEKFSKLQDMNEG